MNKGDTTLQTEYIEKCRCPKGLWFFKIKWVRKIFSHKKERNLAQAKKGIYKFFRDEVVHLEVFVKRRYSNRCLVLPVNGNQAFDAKVYGPRGNLAEKIEITYPQDGKAIADSTRKMHERGYGTVRVYSIGEDVDALIPFIEETAIKKSHKDYSDCVLTFVLDFDLPYPEHKKEYIKKVKELGLKIGHIHFKAKEVCFLVLPYKDLYYYQPGQLLFKDHRKRGSVGLDI